MYTTDWHGVLLCLANQTFGGGALFWVALYYRVAFYFGEGFTLFFMKAGNGG
jgi:hypothetical protein